MKIAGVVLGYPLLNVQSLQETDRGMSLENLMVLEKLLNNTDSLVLPDNISTRTAPVFLFHTTEDEITSAEDSILFISHLMRHKVACELHLFEKGKHGLALGNETHAAFPEDVEEGYRLWTDLVDNWMKERILDDEKIDYYS